METVTIPKEDYERMVKLMRQANLLLKSVSILIEKTERYKIKEKK